MSSKSANEPLEPATMLSRLKFSLQALAMPGDIQVQLFPEFTCKTDELVLDFGHWADCVNRNPLIELTSEQVSSLGEISIRITTMSEKKGDSVWMEESLSYHPDWSELRHLACRALAAFEWKEDPPPTDRDRYV